MERFGKIDIVMWIFSMFFIHSSSLLADDERSWIVKITTPGKYVLKVTHRSDGELPKNIRAFYSVHTSEKKYQRNIFLHDSIASKPFSILSPDIFSAQNVEVRITGVPEPILKDTVIKLSLVEARSYRVTQYGQKIELVEFKELSNLRAILNFSDNQINLGRTKLIIDSFIDPSLKVSQGEQQLDYMVSAINKMLPLNPTHYDKLIALTRYIYEGGPWNNFDPYRYDFSDPLGTRIKNKLMMNYIHTKRGNCISMPFLFIALGERMGLPLTASTAPLHVFVKFVDPLTGNSISLETTSGAGPNRDIWYQKQFEITDKAIANGVYLNTLTKKETVAVMAILLSEYYLDVGEFNKAIAIATLSLEYYPKHVYAMIKIGNAYHRLADKLYLKKYPTLTDVPKEKRSYYQFLSRNNISWFQKAEVLGWVQPSKEYDQRYLEMVKQNTKSFP